ncbi:receptor-like protein kinase HERK 1 [Rutidosis leptorrhynchoides]|uniref:receptor-like protein kinase HERK 1 n=1 Tax=Rutidosis leptorrhynchoides TaxID=125765 RepID=UPI003A9A0C19
MEQFIRQFPRLKIPLEEILEGTNNFDDKNVIEMGDFGKVYKGKLIRSGKSIKIAARRLSRYHGQRDVEFFREISALSTLEHENIASLIGFCDENGEMIVLHHRNAKGSLVMYLSDITTLSWFHRLKICFNVACAIQYIHNGFGEKYCLIHRNINSSTILLDKSMSPRLSGFEYSLKQSINQNDEVILCEAIGARGYIDPAIEKRGGVNQKSDIYSFGIVLFEILCGRKAFTDNEPLLGQLAKFHYENETLEEIMHPGLWEQIKESKSFKCFAETAYSCLHKDPTQRPDANQVCDKLYEAYDYVHQMIRLQVIVSATNNFSDENLIQDGESGRYYKGKMLRSAKLTDVVARRVGNTYEQIAEFWREINTLHSLSHKNIAYVAGSCDEYGERIIIYERTVHGHLDQNLTDAINLTWIRRLKICLGVAQALAYLHYDVIHCDISSFKILLDEDWEPRIFGFEHSMKFLGSWRHRLLSCNHFNTSNYREPGYLDATTVIPRYDVYSFGVMLFEVLCGRKAWISGGGVDQSLPEMAKRHFADKNLDEIINKGLRKQMDLQSLEIFSDIAYRCLDEQLRHPTMDQVVKKLDDALARQWKHENIRERTTAEVTSINPLKVNNLIYF